MKCNKISVISPWLRVTIVILAALMLGSLILYAFYFNGGITNDHQRWSEFGDYIAGIAGLLYFIAFVVLTVLLHKAEKTRESQMLRFHAEELVIGKIQSQLKTLHGMYIAFQRTNSKDVADDTFELLQPLMTYLYYLKSSEVSSLRTMNLIEEIHNYLFEASDILYCYSQDIERNGNKVPSIVEILKVYREIYRRLERLEVTLLGDIAGVGNEGTNYSEIKNR